MTRIASMQVVQAARTPLGVLVAAVGSVETSGWTHPYLSRKVYEQPPADGLQEFDFNAVPPTTTVLRTATPIAATAIIREEPWLRGIRIHSDGGSADVVLANQPVLAANLAVTELDWSRAHWETGLASFEDSWQPTGKTKIDWGGVHIQMKKLVHQITLRVDGPDNSQIDSCFKEAVGVGLLAAIVATFITGGAALDAAVAAFIGHLEACLGAGFSVKIEDSSHWVTWWT